MPDAHVARSTTLTEPRTENAMRRIHGDVFTYAELPSAERVLKEGTTPATFGVRGRGGPTWTTVQNVRALPGYRVRHFDELVRIAAHLAAGNRGMLLFYRGQSKEYLDRNGRTNLYASIFRSKSGRLMRDELQSRVAKLHRSVKAVVAARDELGLPGRVHRHIEPAIALLQHYGLCQTPLLDITPSLRVAASFALLRPEVRTGYLYVLGLPYPHGTISHFVDQDMVLVRLHGICPYEAVRPHYQEGFLVGKFPIVNAAAAPMIKEQTDNVASRLVAKLVLDDSRGTFFNEGFPRVPESTLLPTRDPFGDRLAQVVRRARDEEEKA